MNQIEKRFHRSKLLFQDKFELLRSKKVLVCGLGGVGGFCFSSLARSGVQVIGIDKDIFDETNQNRQLHSENIGLSKAQVFSQFYKTECYEFVINKTSLDEFLQQHKFDLIIDCIDDLKAKCDIAELCASYKIPLYSSAGAAKRIDASKICVDNWDKTSVCALAKAMRIELKKRNFKNKFKVVYSKEEPMCKELGSFMGVTASFGLRLSSLAIMQLLKIEK